MLVFGEMIFELNHCLSFLAIMVSVYLLFVIGLFMLLHVFENGGSSVINLVLAWFVIVITSFLLMIDVAG